MTSPWPARARRRSASRAASTRAPSCAPRTRAAGRRRTPRCGASAAVASRKKCLPESTTRVTVSRAAPSGRARQPPRAGRRRRRRRRRRRGRGGAGRRRPACRRRRVRRALHDRAHERRRRLEVRNVGCVCVQYGGAEQRHVMLRVSRTMKGVLCEKSIVLHFFFCNIIYICIIYI